MSKLTFFGGIAGLGASTLSIVSIGISLTVSNGLDDLRGEFSFNTLADSCAEVYGSALTIRNAVDGHIFAWSLLEIDTSQSSDMEFSLLFNRQQQSMRIHQLVGDFNVSYRSLLLVSNDETLNQTVNELADTLSNFINTGLAITSSEAVNSPEYIRLEGLVEDAEIDFVDACKRSIQ